MKVSIVECKATPTVHVRFYYIGQNHLGSHRVAFKHSQGYTYYITLQSVSKVQFMLG